MQGRVRHPQYITLQHMIFIIITEKKIAFVMRTLHCRDSRVNMNGLFGGQGDLVICGAQ
jgi:hypothetical protein